MKIVDKPKAVDKIQYFGVKDFNFDVIVEGMIRGTSANEEVAEFRMSHIRRVKDIAIKLANHEMKFDRLLSIDMEKVEIMCLVHDMFKYTDDVDHGKAAANVLREQFVKPWLNRAKSWMQKKAYVTELAEWQMVYDALINHSDKGMPESKAYKNVYMRVMIDADVLDHISTEYVEQYSRLFMTSGCREERYLLTASKYLGRIFEYPGLSIGYRLVRRDLVDALQVEIGKYINGEDLEYLESYYKTKILPIISTEEEIALRENMKAAAEG